MEMSKKEEKQLAVATLITDSSEDTGILAPAIEITITSPRLHRQVANVNTLFQSFLERFPGVFRFCISL